MKEAITNLLLSNQPADSIGYNLYNSLPTDELLPDRVTNHVKLQHGLTEKHHKSKVQEFTDHLSTSRDRSHFQSLQGQSAEAWLSAFQRLHYLPKNLATLIRLGFKTPQSTGRCDCGRDLDQEGYHLVTMQNWMGSYSNTQCYRACLVRVFDRTELPAQQRTDSSIPQQRQQTRHCCY